MSGHDHDGRDGEARDDELAHALGSFLRAATIDQEEARRDVPELRRRDAAARQRLVEAIGAPSTAGTSNRSGWRSWGRSGVAVASPARMRAGRGLALAAAVAMAAFAAFWFLRSPELDYAVTGASEVAGYIRAEAGTATVSFEDGTAIELARGASGRVSDVRANGARFVLEDGAIDGRFAKRPGAAWSVHAGPWEIRVTGTEFGVAWDARRTALRVVMREGSVVVQGPGAEEGIGLRAGQTLEVGEEGAIRVASIAGRAEGDRALAEQGGSSTSTGGSNEAAPAPAPAPAVAAAPVTTGEPTAARPWPARVAAGDYDGVLAEADARGIDAVLGAASAADLSAVADAARYRGRSGLATRALQALRDRFAGTAAAANAAFLLGRMADDAGSGAAAIRWYDAHLAEGGAFAAEAMGRKMLAVRRSSGDAAAASVARAYLERFPRGAHAPLARSLTEIAAPSPEATPAPLASPPGSASPAPTQNAPDRGVMPTLP